MKYINGTGQRCEFVGFIETIPTNDDRRLILKLYHLRFGLESHNTEKSFLEFTMNERLFSEINNKFKENDHVCVECKIISRLDQKRLIGGVSINSYRTELRANFISSIEAIQKKKKEVVC